MLDEATISRRTLFGAAVLGLTAAALQSEAEAKSPKSPPVGALLPLAAVMRAHDQAFSAHDLKGVLATMSPDAFVLGSGGGEIWKGTKEITARYEDLFKTFEKGSLSFEPVFYDGAVQDGMGWLMGVTRVTATHAGKRHERGINASIGFVQSNGKWQIRTFHYSSTPAH